MKLRVIAGAKEGAEVPLKKKKFVIGRASDCTLRASSDAVSRHHCALLRTETGGWIARDLGSRNGTLVNGEKIERETPLVDGDQLQVGPLQFLVLDAADLNREKKPAVKSVAEAVERAAESKSVLTDDDDISRWLLGPEPVRPPESARETQTLRLDETHAVERPADTGSKSSDGEETLAVAEPGVDPDADEGDSGDSGFGKKRDKRKPGKLPPIPQKPIAKDSCEAAADILREMARRR